jgi:hypothetical protein
MLNATSAYQSTQAVFRSTTSFRADVAAKSTVAKSHQGDTVQFGVNPPNASDSQRVVLERAMEKLRSVVSEARAALGLPEDAVLDTSPEATANRIADFALNFFSKYAENHGLANDEAGRQQYADFIGKAIAQGISEARGILDSLQALNGEVSGNIDTTSDIIESRLQDFVANGLAA